MSAAREQSAGTGEIEPVLHLAGITKRFPAVTALDKVDTWLSLDQTRLVQETDDHWHILQDLLAETGPAGNLTTDAHLAALAISHGATLVSFDNDFSRFPGLRWKSPPT